MDAKLILTRLGESWGDADRRTHQQESLLMAEERRGTFAITIKQGALNSHDDAPEGMKSRPEATAKIYLDRDEVMALAAFLGSLPADD